MIYEITSKSFLLMWKS